MSRTLYVVDSSGRPQPVWPSIASASAQLRRPRRLEVVPARAERIAVLDRAARPRPPLHEVSPSEYTDVPA